ncbi:MAG: homoserine dehydrogenase [Thermodesulfobacteriota bacterium]
MPELPVGLLGCGTVGLGVARIILEKAELIRSRVGVDIRLAGVADINADAVRDLGLAPGVFTTDAVSIAEDPNIPVVIELIGGKTVARDLILRALSLGKSVVTANKALIASHHAEIAETAEKGNGELYYEASVGGCMPVIKTLREALAGNRVESAFGILNGTCNYILTRIAEDKLSYEQALAEAQQQGFAEADPFLDVSGMDTAHKLAIVVALSHGSWVELSDIYVEGISRLTPMDIEFAADFGYRIKLLAITKNRGNRIEARVHPTMVPFDNLLASVNGAMNAVKIVGDATGEMVLYGQGAGRMPTASAVVSDLCDIARNRACGIKNRLPIFSFRPGTAKPMDLLPMSEVETSYYMRFAAQDRPGVLSKIAGALGKQNISISSVHQKGRKTEGPVPIVLLTHRAREADVMAALDEIANIDVIAERPVLIRIEEEDR